MPVDPPVDEFEQYRVGAKTAAPADEYAQYKAAPAPPAVPDTIGVNRDAPPSGSPDYQYSTGYQGPQDAPRDSGGFIDRMTTQAGRALQNPMNFVPSWKSLLGPLNPDPVIQGLQQWKNVLSGAPEPPREDMAKVLGNQAPAAITALVTHAADVAGNPMQARPEPIPRVPIWQRPGTTTTPTEPGFNWQGSTPEEIQAHLSQMANRPKAVRVEGQPADIPQAAPQYQVVKLGGVKPPAAQGATPNLPEMTPSPSTTVASHGYDPAKQQMFMTFKNGNTYRYSGVPQEVYDQYLNSESHGSFHANNIKGRYQTDLVSKGQASSGQRVSQALSQNQPQLYGPASNAAFNRMNPPEDVPQNWGVDQSPGPQPLNSDAFAAAHQQARTELGPDAPMAQVIARRDQLAGGRPTGDIGEQVRANMPPLPRGGKK